MLYFYLLQRTHQNLLRKQAPINQTLINQTSIKQMSIALVLVQVLGYFSLLLALVPYILLYGNLGDFEPTHDSFFFNLICFKI